MTQQTTILSLEHYGATSPSQKIIPIVGGGRAGDGGGGSIWLEPLLTSLNFYLFIYSQVF